MTPRFGRGGGDHGERTAAEREADRLERERRRAQRTGEHPAVPPAADPEPPAPEVPAPAEPAPSPPAEETGEVLAPAAPSPAEPAPPAPAEPARRAPEPDADWDQPPSVVVRGRSEQPLGTRRVAASQVASAAGAPPPRRQGISPNEPPARRRRGLRRAGPLVVLVAILLLGWFLVNLVQPFTGSGSGRVVVQIPEGASTGDIGSILADKGVVSSSFFFELRARLSGDRGKLRAGTYVLKHDMSYSDALSALTSAPKAARTVSVTIPEGRSIRETVPIIRQAGLHGGYLKAARDPQLLRAVKAPRSVRTLEGYLFPSTYEVRTGAQASVLVAKQVQTFRKTIASVDLRYARTKNLTTYDVLTIASMIEREAAVDRDRPLIAAVIYNRLKRHMALGIDATIRYALHDWTSPLTQSQLQSTSPYNTRLHLGLPPTPIGNPGLASIKAAAHPAKVGYLFYVVKPCGNGAHAFSSTDAQFQRDVAAYNAARAKRGGKDPSHC